MMMMMMMMSCCQSCFVYEKEISSSLKGGIAALKFVSVLEHVLEVLKGQPLSGVVGNQSLVAGDVVAESRQSRRSHSLHCPVLVAQQVHYQTEVEAGLSEHDLRRHTITCADIKPPHAVQLPTVSNAAG